jgi:hypothetical protein
MKMISKINDGVAIGAGYFSVDPNGEIFSRAHQFLTAIPVLDPGTAGEILKMLAGLIIALLSDFLHKIISEKLDKRKEKKEAAKVHPAPPDSVTTNLNKNEKESK